MKKEDPPASQSKASLARLWYIGAALLIVSLGIGGWKVASQITQPAPTEEKVAVSHEIPKDTYIASKDIVYKFSGRDGSVLWTFALKQAYKPDRIIGSYLQLAVVNDVVYAALEYRIYALNANTGKEIWQYSPKLTAAEQAQGHGRIAEMIVDKNFMYLQLVPGNMAALDLHDGSLKWSNLSFPNGGSFSASDDTLYVSEFSRATGPLLHAIDGKTGKERWHFTRQFISISTSTTFVSNGIVYSSGNPLYALDARTGKQLWEQRLPAGPMYFDTLQIRNGVAYVNTSELADFVARQTVSLDPYRIFAFDAQTGKIQWESKPGYQLRDEVIDGGKNLLVEDVLQEDAHLQALDAMTGTQRWQLALGTLSCDTSGSCSPQIGVSENHLYVLARKRPYTLQIFDVQTGRSLGQHSIAIAAKEVLDLSLWSNGVLYTRSSLHEGDPYSSGSSTSFTHYFIHTIRLADGVTSWSHDLGSLLDVQVPITKLLMGS